MAQFHTLPLDFESTCRAGERITLGPRATLLRGFAESLGSTLLAAIDDIRCAAPLRHMITPGGGTMSVAMTNCGARGWVSDRSGYRYVEVDPTSGHPWPSMPESLRALATSAASTGGFPAFVPDACLINQYCPGSHLSLHQDRDELDLSAPVVSVSLGLPAVFVWGGHRRTDRSVRVPLSHGDVVVWGGVDRLRYHGVNTLAGGVHPQTGALRFNLTFRKAL